MEQTDTREFNAQFGIRMEEFVIDSVTVIKAVRVLVRSTCNPNY